MNLPLFCFGSLMDLEVLACVLDTDLPRRLEFEQGTLAGFKKVRLPHESYPLLVNDVQGETAGVLIHHLNKDELDRIVFFEGEEYELAPCEVDTGSKKVSALFFDEGIMPPAHTTAWDFEVWKRDHKQYLIRQSRAYMSWYGKMSAAEADVYWQNYSE